MYDETIAGTGPNEVISLLDYLLVKVHQEQGKYQTLIVWVDNSPAQFKENYLFFTWTTLLRKGTFLELILNFCWKGIRTVIATAASERFRSISTTKKLFKYPKTGQLF